MARERAGADPPSPDPPRPDPKVLIDIARQRMPFGRYEGTRLIDLPEPYVVWFRKQGFPRGRLGVLLATLYDIKANGLEPLLAPFREPDDPRYREASTRPFVEGER
jgi:uncharacterized protein (DUF3820 family)